MMVVDIVQEGDDKRSGRKTHRVFKRRLPPSLFRERELVNSLTFSLARVP